MSINIPLAERLRPKCLEDYLGQEHLVGENGIFHKFLSTGSIPSFILWGPPGIGKTTLANIIANGTDREFISLSAVNSGVKDVREAIERAKHRTLINSKPPILFIDEIHRFSKSQQDSLLSAVEQGIVTLIGATTENPSFEVIRPLLSRCQVYVLSSLSENNMMALVNKALENDTFLKSRNVSIDNYEAILRFAAGDARKLLNILEIVISAIPIGSSITNEIVLDILNENIAQYDKGADMHYDVVSAFIKSIRGSDPNAAIYYLAKMVNGGEDPKFIARRLVISASEDIGLANPNALLIANSCFDAVSNIGMPEGRIPLAQATIYLATSPKSNSAYMAINEAMAFIKNDDKIRNIPLSLRNAPTELMESIGYGGGYKYSHNYPNHFVYQEFMPEGLENKTFYRPSDNQKERIIADTLTVNWNDKYK